MRLSLKEEKICVSGKKPIFSSPQPEEDRCLDKILEEYSLEVVTTNGHTFFQSKQNLNAPL